MGGARRCLRTYAAAQTAITAYAIRTNGAAPIDSSRIPLGTTTTAPATSTAGIASHSGPLGHAASSTRPQHRYQGQAAGPKTAAATSSTPR